MKTSQVRCWKVGGERKLFITYPEGEMGHRLICCVSCGQIYSVSVTKQIYIEPDLEVQLQGKKCVSCLGELSHNWEFYPEKYLGESGELESFERPSEMPDGAESVVQEFPEIY